MPARYPCYVVPDHRKDDGQFTRDFRLPRWPRSDVTRHCTVSWGQQHPLPAQLPHAPCQQWQRLMMKSSSAGLTSILELEHTYWYFCFRMKVTRLETQETKNRFIRCSNEISQLSVIMNARCLMSINSIYLTVCLGVFLFSKEKSGEV